MFLMSILGLVMMERIDLAGAAIHAYYGRRVLRGQG